MQLGVRFGIWRWFLLVRNLVVVRRILGGLPLAGSMGFCGVESIFIVSCHIRRPPLRARDYARRKASAVEASFIVMLWEQSWPSDHVSQTGHL